MTPRVTIFRDKNGNWIIANGNMFQDVGQCLLKEAYQQAIDSGFIEKGSQVFVRENNDTTIYPK